MSEEEREDRGIDDLLRTLDHRRPEISAEEVIRRARRSRRTRLPLLAGLAAVLGLAGVSYALPGSPVRGWVRSVIETDTGNGRQPPADSSERPPAAGSGAGMVFDPAESLIVRVSPASDGHLLIELTDEAEIVARMVAGDGRFTADPNELALRLEALDTLELLIPRRAHSVEVIAGERSLFAKRGSVIRAEMEPDAEGRYRIDLGGGP